MSDIPYKSILCESDRLSTFKHWPFKEGPCIPANLAKAGFFYTGKRIDEDYVRCFVCFKLLCDWGKDDDPFVEHQKHAADCAFVKLGQDQSNLILSEMLELLRISLKKLIEHIGETKRQEERDLIKSYGIEIEKNAKEIEKTVH